MLALASPSAWAGDVSLALGVGYLHDLQTQRAGKPKTDLTVLESDSCDEEGTHYCGPRIFGQLSGARIAAPVRIALTPRATLRVGPRFEYGGRKGQILADCSIIAPGCDAAGDGYRYAQDHFAFSFVGGVAVGPEFSIPVNDASLYFGTEIMLGAIYSFESLGPAGTAMADGGNRPDGATSPTDGLIDQRDPSCDTDISPNQDGTLIQECSIEARTFQAAVGVDVLVGFRTAGPFFVEAGYGAMTAHQTQLKPGYAPGGNSIAQRAQYLWNPLRVTVGMVFEL
ncbi:MAG: hypothetical protein R3F61_03660 [Myxococcota bacterium]